MIYTVSEIAATLSDIVLLVWFVPRFNYNRFYQKKAAMLIPIGLAVFALMADYVLPIFNAFSTGVFILAVIAYSLAVSDKRFLRSFLGACLFIIVLMLSGSFLYMLLSLFVPDMSALDYGAKPELGSFC